jgi:virulence-associated protein VapD
MDTEKQMDNIRDSIDVLCFIKDNFSLYIARKIVRIITAFYLVTSHLDVLDDIRQKIRKKTLELIDCIAYLDRENIKDIQNKFFQINSLLDIGLSIGAFSEQNVLILKEQLYKTLEEIKEQQKTGFDNNSDVNIDQNFFDVETKKEIKPIKDNRDIKKDTQGHKDIIKKSLNIKPFQNISGKRSEEILEIIKNKGNVMIKDISSEITDCSEKTIQRELQKLVFSGVLKKEGERRWSTYSLI